MDFRSKKGGFEANIGYRAQILLLIISVFHGAAV